MFKNYSGFNKNVERATSNLLLEPDWDAILAICDAIRGDDVSPTLAVQLIKKRLQEKNPHTQMYTIQLLDAVLKNCGKPVYDEIINGAFMDELRIMARNSPEEVRNRILEVLQCWANGFRDKPQYKCVSDTVTLLKLEGYKFPAMKESDALFVAEAAPEWKDGDVCDRCRTGFSLTVRKHHCRHCGGIFCSKCSSKVCALPKFGIEKEVRVCDPCFELLTSPVLKSVAAKAVEKENDLPPEYLNSPLAKEAQVPPKRTKEEIEEEEQLQLALAISQSEAEAKAQQKQRPWTSATTNSSASNSNANTKSNAWSNGERNQQKQQEANGDLDKYLNRGYWEEKQQEINRTAPVNIASEPSAPTPSSTPSLAPPTPTPSKSEEVYQNGESDEIQHFIAALKTQISVFSNRMKSNVSRRRPLVNDPTMLSFFSSLLPLRQQLLEYIHNQENWKEYYERLQEKLTRLREAREALDVLREEHRERLRREAEERHRAMQMQMIAKLDTLRVKKREYLDYQRQMAFQQIQAQEQEMLRRKQIYQPYAYVPGGLATAAPPGAMGQNFGYGYNVPPGVPGGFNGNYGGQPMGQQPQMYGQPQHQYQPGFAHQQAPGDYQQSPGPQQQPGQYNMGPQAGMPGQMPMQQPGPPPQYAMYSGYGQQQGPVQSGQMQNQPKVYHTQPVPDFNGQGNQGQPTVGYQQPVQNGGMNNQAFQQQQGPAGGAVAEEQLISFD